MKMQISKILLDVYDISFTVEYNVDLPELWGLSEMM